MDRTHTLDPTPDAPRSYNSTLPIRLLDIDLNIFTGFRSECQFTTEQCSSSFLLLLLVVTSLLYWAPWSIVQCNDNNRKPVSLWKLFSLFVKQTVEVKRLRGWINLGKFDILVKEMKTLLAKLEPLELLFILNFFSPWFFSSCPILKPAINAFLCMRGNKNIG